jgi:hypothetical protein
MFNAFKEARAWDGNRGLPENFFVEWPSSLNKRSAEGAAWYLTPDDDAARSKADKSGASLETGVFGVLRQRINFSQRQNCRKTSPVSGFWRDVASRHFRYLDNK